MEKKNVLITGASTGLGLALGKLLIQKESFRCFLSARRSSLHRFETQGIKTADNVEILPLDVTSHQERCDAIKEIDEFGGVDILINNAGFAFRSVVEDASPEERLKQMEVNYRGPMALIGLVLPSMRGKRRGQIINVSSASGLMGMPTMALYSASKFALEGASECLWYEVKPWNISVSIIEPGFINSSAYRKTQLSHQGRKVVKSEKRPYFEQYTKMESFIERLMKLSPSSPEDVARVIYKKVIKTKRPRLRVAATPDAFFLTLFRRFFPRRLYHKILYRSLPHT